MTALIDTAQIASLLGMTREYVTDRLTKRTDFPKPRVDLSRRMKRWAESDIRAWLATYKNQPPPPDPCPPPPKGPDIAEVRRTLAKKLEGAQRRSRLNGRPCTIKIADLLALYDEQCGLCAVSGKALAVQLADDGPASITIDWRDSSEGYEPDNIRLVCLAVNLMMNRWGDGAYHGFAATTEARP